MSLLVFRTLHWISRVRVSGTVWGKASVFSTVLDQAGSIGFVTQRNDPRGIQKIEPDIIVKDRSCLTVIVVTTHL
jgi:hypothetical protein